MTAHHHVIDRLRLIHRQTLTTMRAIGASVMLTMRLFDLLPDRDVRPQTAIVRELIREDVFDPRERLPNGIVLTLPFPASDQPTRRPFVNFSLN